MFSDSNKHKRVRSDSICTSIDSNNSSPIDSTLFDPEFDALFENYCLSEQQINEDIMQIEESFNTILLILLNVKFITTYLITSVVPIDPSDQLLLIKT